MKTQRFTLGKIPVILWGTPSNQLYIYIHGQNGCKEGARLLASLATCQKWQVLSFDLPEHGERSAEKDSFNPWSIIPELQAIFNHVSRQWDKIALYADSIGAWFSMLSYENQKIDHCLFVSPILDMRQIIFDMMLRANVSENQLQRQLLIPTSFGHTLSWEYLTYTQQHPIVQWNVSTKILYGGHDSLVKRSIAEDFSNRFHCKLTVMESCEHWFHTPDQLERLSQWIENNLE